MLSRNLIATVIKTFFEELDDRRDGGRKGQESRYVDLYIHYFKRDREWFIKAEARDITAFFADDPFYKLEMLAELMYRDARTEMNEGERWIIYRKLIELYDVIDMRSGEFSMERMNRVAELKQAIG